MPTLRFHLLGLAHLETNSENSACAYTQKIVKLSKMLKSLGHTVFFYGVEGSRVECDNFVEVSSQAILKKTYGDYDRSRNFFRHNPNDLAHMTFNSNAIESILKNRADGDFLLCPLGNYQKPISDAVNLCTVESGIGYTGVFSNYRVFESYAWMHYIYGLMGIEDGAWYDAVIPNYFDVSDFPFNDKKDDYLLYFGRIISRKGVSVASDAAKKCGKKLYIVGQGSLDNPDEGLSLSNEAHIIYHPAVGAKERAELLKNAKAVLMPTYYLEPFGGVNVEAQLCGTPVITSDWGAFPETVLHGKTGYRCRTLEEFCWAIDNIDNINPSDCRAWASENYSLERVSKMYDEYFARIHRNNWYGENDTRKNLDWLTKYFP